MEVRCWHDGEGIGGRGGGGGPLGVSGAADYEVRCSDVCLPQQYRPGFPSPQPLSFISTLHTCTQHPTPPSPQAATAIPCIVSFSPGQERRVYFAVSGPALAPARLGDFLHEPRALLADPRAQTVLMHSSPAVVLADPAPKRLHAGEGRDGGEEREEAVGRGRVGC